MRYMTILPILMITSTTHLFANHTLKDDGNPLTIVADKTSTVLVAAGNRAHPGTGAINLTNTSTNELEQIQFSASPLANGSISIANQTCATLEPGKTCGTVLQFTPSKVPTPSAAAIQAQEATINISYMLNGKQYHSSYHLDAATISSITLLPTPLQQYGLDHLVNSIEATTVAVNYNHVIVGSNNGLSISDDNGNTFRNATILNGFNIVDVKHLAVDNTGQFIVAANDHDKQYLLSTNGGVTFTSVPLNNSTVNDLTIVGGTLYVATSNGLIVLNLYQPTASQTYTTHDGLPSNNVLAVSATSNSIPKAIYALTDKGLAIDENSANHFSNINSSIGKGDTGGDHIYTHFYSDDTPQIYMINQQQGDIKISTDNGKTFTKQTNISGARDLAFNGDTAYLATTNGLQVSNGANQPFQPVTPTQFTPKMNAWPSLANNMINIATDTASDTTFVISEAGVIQLNNLATSAQFLNTSVTANSAIYGLSMNEQGFPIINSQFGMTFQKMLKDHNFDTYQTINTIHGGYGYHFVGKPFYNPEGKIYAISKSSDNTFTLNIRQNSDATFTSIQLPTTITNPTSVYVDSSNSIYITNAGNTNDAGVFISFDQGKHFKSFLLGHPGYATIENPSNNMVYVSTSNGLFYMKKGLPFTEINLPNPPATQNQSTSNSYTNYPIASSDSNIIYVVAPGNNGLDKLTVDRSGAMTHCDYVSTKNGLTSNHINAMGVDAANEYLYVATDKGLQISADKALSFQKPITTAPVKFVAAANSRFITYLYNPAIPFDIHNKVYSGVVGIGTDQ